MTSVLCIGGVDPSGGAGLAADLKTLSALDVHGYSIATAITAQNSSSFSGYTKVSEEDIRRQWQSILDECIPEVIKVGLLPDLETFHTVFNCLQEVKSFVIYDPVLATSSGFQFSLVASDIHRQLERVDLLTPNADEAEVLDHSRARAVLLKGGHLLGDVCMDQLILPERTLEIKSLRKEGNLRGTGCTLSSAIAGFYSRSKNLAESVIQAKNFINQCFNSNKYLHYRPWPSDEMSFPWIGEKQEQDFASCGSEPLGLYPIVDRASWLERLLPLGVKTIQLRSKDLQGTSLENEIKTAVRLSEKFNCRLFINDFWELALKHRAYGTHLGQEDLQELSHEQVQDLQKSGIRLGISTHSYEEAAVAHSYSPSYIALGPIYETTAKKMKFAPQGLERIKIWSQMLPYPLVAIGGMTPERGCASYQAGADGVAVMSDIVGGKNPESRTAEWLSV